MAARELRQRILNCWDRIDGDKLLDQYAPENFGEFLKAITKLLPRGIDLDLTGPRAGEWIKAALVALPSSGCRRSGATPNATGHRVQAMLIDCSAHGRSARSWACPCLIAGHVADLILHPLCRVCSRIVRSRHRLAASVRPLAL